METLLRVINAGACGLISLALIGAVLSPKVHDGVIIKVGLISLAAGFGALALRMVSHTLPNEIVGIQRALLLVNAGIAVVIIGYLLRKAKNPKDHLTDWSDL